MPDVAAGLAAATFTLLGMLFALSGLMGSKSTPVCLLPSKGLWLKIDWLKGEKIDDCQGCSGQADIGCHGDSACRTRRRGGEAGTGGRRCRYTCSEEEDNSVCERLGKASKPRSQRYEFIKRLGYSWSSPCLKSIECFDFNACITLLIDECCTQLFIS